MLGGRPVFREFLTQIGISLFKLLRQLGLRELQQLYVTHSGGTSSLLHHGPKRTPEIEIALEFAQGDVANFYRCELEYANERLLFTRGVLGLSSYQLVRD